MSNAHTCAAIYAWDPNIYDNIQLKKTEDDHRAPSPSPARASSYIHRLSTTPDSLAESASESAAEAAESAEVSSLYKGGSKSKSSKRPQAAAAAAVPPTSTQPSREQSPVPDSGSVSNDEDETANYSDAVRKFLKSSKPHRSAPPTTPSRRPVSKIVSWLYSPPAYACVYVCVFLRVYI